jgi:hypothetical protein
MRLDFSILLVCSRSTIVISRKVDEELGNGKGFLRSDDGGRSLPCYLD